MDVWGGADGKEKSGEEARGANPPAFPLGCSVAKIFLLDLVSSICNMPTAHPTPHPPKHQDAATHCGTADAWREHVTPGASLHSITLPHCTSRKSPCSLAFWQVVFHDTARMRRRIPLFKDFYNLELAALGERVGWGRVGVWVRVCKGVLCVNRGAWPL